MLLILGNNKFHILEQNRSYKGGVIGTIKAFLALLLNICNSCGMWCGMLRDVVGHTSRNKS